MNEAFLKLNRWDLSVFIGYLLITVLVGFWVARKGSGTRQSAKNYFLGGRHLPWYVIGASMVSTNISSEHFIANVGAGYKYGLAPATGSWNVWIIYSLLIWIFLPYYVRSDIYTMPQFLERRYNETCRYIFAVALVAGYVVAIIGGSLYAGGVTLRNLFDINLVWGIIFFAVVTGAYTIYGGLTSAAWTDFLQMIVLLAAGILVPILGLIKVGGIVPLAQAHPEHFQIFLPTDHEVFPFTGVLTGFLTVGIWYSCTSQHIVQRVLSAKDEWHARMGVVSAGFLHMISPLFFVVPGIIALHLFPTLSKPDEGYLMLVKTLVPTGLRGLILAGIAAALMSTLSAVLNSASTLVTVDLYRKFRELNAKTVGEREQVLVGQFSGVIILAIGMVAAFWFARSPRSLFVNIQDVFFYIAPPFSVIFTLGLLWRRANGIAAVTTIVGGFCFTFIVQHVVVPRVPAMKLFANYYHRALLAWVFCMAVMIAVSLLTKPPPAEKVDGIIWSRRYAMLPPELQQRYRGWKDFRIWWAIFVIGILGLYAFFVWWRMRYPIDMIRGA